MNTLFFRLLDQKDKAAALSEAVDAVREGRLLNSVVHAVDPVSFRQVPGSPFAYWVSERLRRSVCRTAALRGGGADGSEGFYRWTISLRALLVGSRLHSAVMGLGEWRAFAKGGMFSPFYADIHLVVDWEPRRSTFLGFFGRPGREIERPESLASSSALASRGRRRTNGFRCARCRWLHLGQKAPAALWMG